MANRCHLAVYNSLVLLLQRPVRVCEQRRSTKNLLASVRQRTSVTREAKAKLRADCCSTAFVSAPQLRATIRIASRRIWPTCMSVRRQYQKWSRLLSTLASLRSQTGPAAGLIYRLSMPMLGLSFCWQAGGGSSKMSPRCHLA